MIVIGVKEQFLVWAERQRSKIRIKHDLSLATLIADITDKARKNFLSKDKDFAMLGTSYGKGKGQSNSQNNPRDKGIFNHCKICGNPKARHTTEKCLEDPRNKEARTFWEKINNKKWVDCKKEKNCFRE